MVFLELNDYSLESIESGHYMMLLNWRNSPQIHSKMLTDHRITENEHFAWLKRIQADPVKKNFIFSYKGTPSGYVGYSDFNENPSSCSPSVYLAPKAELPKNAGLYLFYLMNEYAFSRLNITVIKTEVFKDNKAAVLLNRLTGYEEDGGSEETIIKDGERKIVKHFALDKEQWLSLKNDLLNFITG